MNKSNDPIMYVFVKNEDKNKIFQGMEFASQYIQGNQGPQVSIHMEKQTAWDYLAIPVVKNSSTFPPSEKATSQEEYKHTTNTTETQGKKIEHFFPAATCGATEQEENPSLLT